MKQLYKILILLMWLGFGNFIHANNTIKDYILSRGTVLLPTATISTDRTLTCVDATSPTVTLTAQGGTAPYTFNYTINGVLQPPIITEPDSDIVEISVPTDEVNIFIYQLVSVSDSSGIQAQTDSVIIQIVNPSVDFTHNANANSCSGDVVMFTSVVTNGSSDYTYQWDFGDGNTSGLENPTHIFTSLGCATGTFTVSLTIFDGNGCSATITHDITVKQQPDTNFVDQINPFDPFSNCFSASSSSPDYEITVGNASIGTACITSYSIDWGDGSVEANINFPLSHTYTQLGAYNMVITAEGVNGCSVSKSYLVKNVTNPSGGLTSPGNTQNLCAPTPDLQFTISNWALNSPETTYQLNYGDGSPAMVLNQSQLLASPYYNAGNPSLSLNFPVPHSYAISNCPAAQFVASLTVTNACGSTTFTVDNIVILAAALPDFISPPIACEDTSVFFENITSVGFGPNCNQNAIYRWDFGDGSPIVTTTPTSPTDINHTFTEPGTYIVSLTAANFCGTSEPVTRTICIESPLNPQFTLNDTEGCIPFEVTVTNTTDLSNVCETPAYLWTVTYANGNCGTSSDYTFINGTTSASANPSISFLNAGTYTLMLTTTNTCGSFSTSQVITVKQPPMAVIDPIADVCGSATLNPTALITSCAPVTEVLTYAWSFPGGIPLTANTEIPGAITYDTPGDYVISLTVSNECGAQVATTETFTIKEIPEITNSDLTQTICSGSQTTAVTLETDSPGTTFSWTATATAGISGFAVSGSTAVIPVQTITTTNTLPGTVTYTITPTLDGCAGDAINYTIIVNPAPIFTSQPVSSTICEGGIPTQLAVTIANFTGTPTYQWYSNTIDDTVSGTLIPDAESNTLNPPSNVIGNLYYYVIVNLPSGGCSNIISNTALVTVIESPAITTHPIPFQSLCIGGTLPLSLSVAYSGGVGTVSVQWFSNVTNDNATGTVISGATALSYTPPVFTSAGTFYYYAQITFSGSGCGTVTSDVSEVVIVADPVVDIQPLASQNLCQGAVPTGLEVNATGGIGTYSYQWYSNIINNTTSGTLIPGATTAVFSPPTTAIGTLYYYVQITQDGVGCNTISNTAEVIVNASPIITMQPASNSVCEGGTFAALTIAYENGVGVPSYQWYSNNINSTEGASIIVGATSDSYLPPSAIAGTTYYFVEIIFGSGGGCSNIISDIATIEVTPGATITSQPVATQSLCVGANLDAPLSAVYSEGSGAPSYQWFSSLTNSNVGGTLIPGATNSDYMPPVFTAEGTFYYYVVVTLSGSGCGPATSDVAEIIIESDPIITSQPLVSQALCQDVLPTPLTVAASGGIGMFSYQWYSNTIDSNVTGTIIPGATNDTFTPPTATAGTIYYYVQITQTGIGCSVTSATAEVIVNIAPSITIQPASNIYCFGQTPAVLSVLYANGVGIPAFQWYSNTVNTTIGATAISGATDDTFTPFFSSAGTLYYFATITFSTGGCNSITSDIASITINQNPEISAKTAIICSGNAFSVVPDETNGDIVPSGTTYTWPLPVINPAGTITGAIAEATPQTSISQVLINTTNTPSTVTYTVTPMSGTCPGNSFTVTVTVNPSVNPNVVVNNSTCFGVNNGSIQTNITGGIPFNTGDPYLISWTGPNGFTSTAPSISNLEPGIYNLSVTDQGGCPFSDSFTITEPTDITIITDTETDITCFGNANGAISISVSGGTGAYTYSWTKDTAPFATTQDISNLEPGVYEVSVSDANNCGPKTVSFTIVEPPILTLALASKTDVLCFGASTGSINVNVGGGTPNYTFAWSGPDGFISTSQNLVNISAGNYNLIVTDTAGCAQNLSVSIIQPTEIIITATKTEITCFGANNASITVSVSGGNAPYQIGWSNLGTGFFQDNLSAGDYIITITDASNCTKTLTVNIPEAPLFAINPVVSNISCFGANDGSITLNLEGGIAPISLVWSDGSISGTVRNNLPAGTYTVTITDSKPCVITETFTIIEPQPLVLSANITNAFDCDVANSGAINLLVSGGTAPFTYNWSNGAVTEDIANLPAGNYQVTVTDSRGCTQTASYSINRQPPVVIAVDTKTIADCEAKEIKQVFEARVSGGVPPYQLNWSSGTVSGANNEFMETSQSGTVILNVIDNLGCTASYSFNVEVPDIGETSFTQSSFSFSAFGTYSINDPIQFTNTSAGDYESIVWNFGDGILSSEENPTHIYTREGSYVVTLTVVYPFGCTYVRTITLLIDKGYKIMMPTGFTPNGDNINDIFTPLFLGMKNVEMSIYNTWGEMIYFEKGETIRGWDGQVKGRDAENGNYFFKVIATPFYGGEVKQDGPFTLIK